MSWRRRDQPSPPPLDPVEPSSVAGETAQLRQALDSLTAGVVVVNARGEMILRNSAARRSDGHATVLLDAAVERQLKEALAGATTSETVDLYGPPRRVHRVDAVPLENGGALATIDDISERVRLDAVRTDFVANISHELKTPIGAIAVLAETLSESDDPGVMRRLSGRMVDEAHRLARTVDDLLELSRIELGGEPLSEVVGAAAVIEDAVGWVRPLAERRDIRLHVGAADAPMTAHDIGDLKVVGDRRQLVSALSNMVNNAVKYSDDGNEVRIRALESADSVVFEVSDDGIGIPSRDLARIFERFYRVDRARSRDTGGTGLGLAIVRHVATNHHGDVTVESREGEGSTFSLRIPSSER